MIQNLRIKNFVLIDDIDIDFNKGFNVVIGETGAGKSILVNALSLLTGTRSQFDKLNDETKKAIIEATFVLDDSFIKEHDYLNEFVEDNTLIISRSLSPTKATTIRINGEVVSLNELKRVMQDVVSITSQGEQNSLMQRKEQLKIVDKFIPADKYKKVKEEYLSSYNNYLDKIKDRDEFVESNKDKDLDILTFKLEEINKKNIFEDEIEIINSVLEQADKRKGIIEGGSMVSEVYNSDTFSELTRSLTRGLRMLEDTILSTQAELCLENLDRLNDNLYSIVSSVESDEDDQYRIDQFNERLYELTPLIKKYGPTTKDILNAKKDLEDRLDEANNYDMFLKEKENAIEVAKEEAYKHALILRELRKEAKERIVKACNSHLESLGLRKDGFDISFDECELSLDGVDSVSFDVSLNKGHPFVPLAVAASGGEKSRLMLALIASFNAINPCDTLIFDEVDTGVSGTIAMEVGKKILEISKSSTLVAISHLPPVVASADYYYLVYKYDENEKTISKIIELNEEEKLNELGKMIGGENNLTEAKSLAIKMIKEQKQL